MDALPIKRRYQSMSVEETGFEIGTNVNFVVEHSLCHGCGTCEAACPADAIKMSYEQRRGIYLPVIHPDRCDHCEVCVQACPGFELDLQQKPDSLSEEKEHPLIGSFEGIYRAYSNNPDRRERASSGGLITETIAHLMATGSIDGAIVTRMKEDSPLQAEGYIATNAEDLIASQKSKYCPVPLNRILKPLVQKYQRKRFVFVGLPHHVHGLRLLQRIYPHLHEALPLVISSFTAHVPSQRATEFVLYKNDISPADVKLIEYRGGGNPGRMRILTRQGGEYLVPHLHWTYSGHSFPFFFYPVREWLYFDKISEWADLVMGDNWMQGLQEQKGASTVITRSPAGGRIIRELIKTGKIAATPMTADDLVTDQVLTTKLNIAWRLKIWKLIGRKIPIYSRRFERLRFQQIRTFKFAMLVALCEHKLPYWLLDIIIKADYFLIARPTRFIKRLARFFKRVLAVFLPCRTPVPEKTRRYKAVLIGGYGFFDIGDEAMPHGIRTQLRKHLGDDIEIMMLSPSPPNTRQMHGESSNLDFTHISHGNNASIVRKFIVACTSIFLYLAVLLEKYAGLRLSLWPGARSALDELQSADLLLNVGGGNLNSVIPSELYRKTTTYVIAGILKKPVFLSGQTMGPYYGWFAKRYTRYALNKVRMISFRDKSTSGHRLAEIGVDKPVMFDAADDAISLPGIDTGEVDLIYRKETGLGIDELKKSMLVVLNMKSSLNIFKGKDRSASLDNEINLLARLTNHLVREYQCTVILLPTDFSEGVDDRVPHQAIYDQVADRGSVFQVTGTYTDNQLIGMIGEADIAIGARYHFNVFAASRCVPFLGIASGVYQRTKLEGLANLCGMPECYIDHDMEFAGFDDVWPAVTYLVSHRPEIQARLQVTVPVLKKNSEKLIDEVVHCLKSTAPGH